MADRKFLANLDLNNNQLQNVVIQNLATLPTGIEGKVVFLTTDHTLNVYQNGAWVHFPTTGELETALSLKQDNISFESNSPLSFGTGDNAAQLKIALSTAIAASGSAVDTKVATEKAVRDLHDGIPSETMTFTNKTFDAAGTGNSLSNVSASNFASAALDLGDQETAANATIPSSARVDEKIAAAQLNAIKYRGTWAITAGTTSDMSDLSSFLPIAKGDFFSVSGTGPVTIGGVEYNPGDMIIANAKITAASGLVPSNFDKVDNTESTDLVRLNTTQTLTNKTIDADDNTISDLSMVNFKSTKIALGTSEAAADGVVPSQAKVEELIDAAAPGVDDVTIELFDNTSGGGSTHDLRLKDGGITMPKFNANALSLGTSETQANATLPSTAKVGELIVAERTATATLTGKTIDADDNTISDLETDNFKSGVVVTTIGAASGTGAATDTELPTALAVRTLVDSVESNAIHKATATNPALTQSGGEVSWTFTHGLDRGMLVQAQLFETATGEEVVVNVTRTSTAVVFSWNSSSNVDAGDYTAVVIG